MGYTTLHVDFVINLVIFSNLKENCYIQYNRSYFFCADSVQKIPYTSDIPTHFCNIAQRHPITVVMLFWEIKTRRIVCIELVEKFYLVNGKLPVALA